MQGTQIEKHLAVRARFLLRSYDQFLSLQKIYLRKLSIYIIVDVLMQYWGLGWYDTFPAQVSLAMFVCLFLKFMGTHHLGLDCAWSTRVALTGSRLWSLLSDLILALKQSLVGVVSWGH